MKWIDGKATETNDKATLQGARVRRKALALLLLERGLGLACVRLPEGIAPEPVAVQQAVTVQIHGVGLNHDTAATPSPPLQGPVADFTHPCGQVHRR